MWSILYLWSTTGFHRLVYCPYYMYAPISIIYGVKTNVHMEDYRVIRTDIRMCIGVT